MTVEIVYETHATTLDNERGLASGWLPGHLSESGQKQAKELGKRRRNDHIAVVFVSDLRRAVETAEIAFSDTALPVIQDARLRECNYGDLNGMPTAQVFANRSEHIAWPYPNGQSYNDVVSSMRDFFRDLATGWDGNRVLLIAHSANRWALDHLLGGIPLEALAEAPFTWQAGWLYELPV